jgi:uncharacterized protein
MTLSKNQPLKPQRIRDPLHNLVEFGRDQFEHTLWKVIQTRPFQRLRRVRQLGFSELVFPGATHTRFAHSVGVFHTARQLMQVIKRHIGCDCTRQYRHHQAEVALAAALVHDVGHGMFSHAFEEIGKKLNLSMARHELVSERLIRDGEIADEFKEMGSGFANDVANVISSKKPGNLYDSVVSSQFDADRLDYMQRDRLMTGVQGSGIDAAWLMANLEIGKAPDSADDEASSAFIETLVLGPKAFHAAENYILALFQLYPNVYLHKTTRGAEKLFSRLMLHLIQLTQDGLGNKTGLPDNHPIRRFAAEPDDINRALALDDTVFWGALSMLAEADDPLIQKSALRLRERRLPKCIDLRPKIEARFPISPGMTTAERKKREASIDLKCREIIGRIEAAAQSYAYDQHQILVDKTTRTPYKKFQDSKTPLNQILIRQGEERFEDMAHLSSVVASAEKFEVFRVYYDADDTDGEAMIKSEIGTAQSRTCDGPI